MQSNNDDGNYPYLSDLKKIRENYFLRPDGNNSDHLMAFLKEAVRMVVQHQGVGPTYQRTKPELKLDDVAANAQLSDDLLENPFDVLPSLMGELEGSVKASHPFMTKNVIPLPAWTYFAANLAVSLYMPNAVTGEDAANSVNAELKVAKVYAELAGYDPLVAGGLFTFGGTGTNLYAFKMGISRADPNFVFKGSQNNLVVIGSKPAHYAQQNATNWLGLGRNNYLTARSNTDQTTDLDDLERICVEQIRLGKRIACIVGVGGTTANMAIDDFEQIASMRDQLVRKHHLDYTPHVHSDSVIGWSYLHFADYDFQDNSLGFSLKALAKIRRASDLAKTFKFADSFGIDFHKTGYIPYVSSMIIARNKQDLANLGRDSQMMTPLFFDENAYNPGKYSLETSRSAANMVGTWLTITALGKKGYQILLGHAQEMAQLMRDAVNSESNDTGLFVANNSSYGSDVYIRCYPSSVIPAQQYEKELHDATALSENNSYNSDFYSWLQKSKFSGADGFAIGKTSASFYSPAGDGVTALRIYVLNPYITAGTSLELIKRIAAAKTEFDSALELKPTRAATQKKAVANGPNCWS